LAIVQPEAFGVAPSGPVSRYGVASPAAVSGCAGTMMSQLEFAGGGGAAGVADRHGAAVAGAGGAVAAPVPVADAAGAGTAVGLGAAVAATPGAVEAGAAGPVVADGAGELVAAPVGTGVAAALGFARPAPARGATAATSDMAGLTDPAAAGAAQAPAGPSAVLEALSMAWMCGTLKLAIPATSATIRNPIIGARRVRGRSGKSRYLRASRRRYERTLR
jgi:hypothetical protein